MQLCQCQYSDGYIVDGRLLCASGNNVIYQAQLLSSSNETAQDIRSIIQQWVLSRPAIMIDNLSYQVDPSCSAVVKEVGETSCNSEPTSEQSAADVNTTIVISAAVVGIVLLLLFVVLITTCLFYFHKRKSKKNLDLK